MQLNGQVAFITGGASGLGAETARKLRARGAKVCIVDANAAKLGDVESDLALACDVTSTEQIEAAVESCVEKLGVPRVLVNAAGIGGGARMISRDGTPMPLAIFKRMIDINLVGTFDVTRLVSAEMAKTEPVGPDGERGVILMTASVAVWEGQVGQTPYSASKGGIAALTLPMARELARFGIRVAAIAPGLFNTPMMAALPEKIQTALGQSVPFPSRLGWPSEYASLVQHIVENSYISGCVYRLDGAARLASG